MDTYKQKYYTPEEVAHVQKFDIDLFIDDWLEDHDITDDVQCECIRDNIRLRGWKFFHYEIVEYCKCQNEKYIVKSYDDIIILDY